MAKWALVADEGYDCEFVSPPPKVLQTECSVCLLILREPHLTSCCGHSFCRVCVEKIQNDGKPCPLCNKDEFTTLHNKGLERALKELAVQCEHKGSGCSWNGELGALDNHLTGACPFVEVKCRYDNCHHETKRKDISSHEESCGFRPFCCKWCQKYDTWYDDVTHHHWPVCPKYPVSCLQCNATVEREHVPHHVEEDCLFTMVDCEFSSVGCKARFPRMDLQGHITADQLLHLTMVNRKLVNENAILSRRVSNLEVWAVDQKREVEKMAAEKADVEAKMAKELAQLTVKLSNQERQLDELDKVKKVVECYVKKKIKTLPINLEVTEVENIPLNGEVQLTSCDFYSCFGGYKMRIQLYAESGRNYSSPSIWMRMAFLEGEFDDLLQWPFNGTVVAHIQTLSGTFAIYIDFKNAPLEYRSKPNKDVDCEKYFSQRLGHCFGVAVEQVISDAE